MRLNEVMPPQELDELNLKQLGKGLATVGLAGAMMFGAPDVNAELPPNMSVVAQNEFSAINWNEINTKSQWIQATANAYYKALLKEKEDAYGKGTFVTDRTSKRMIQYKAQMWAEQDWVQQIQGEIPVGPPGNPISDPAGKNIPKEQLPSWLQTLKKDSNVSGASSYKQNVPQSYHRTRPAIK